MHVTDGMPARGEEFGVLRSADTVSVRRNIFLYKATMILVVVAYNKANTNTNNSFYIVRSPCPLVQRTLYVYLVYIRPFRNLVSRSLEILSKNATNPHLFSTHDSAAACFTSDQAHSSLKKSTSNCAVPITTSVHRQVAVSIAKKHLPALVQSFDPNTPKDFNGFLQLLSFQTGHRPVTNASAYALEHGFPTRLQADLIDRYLVNSHMWHEFTLTREEDILDHSLAAAYNAPSSISRVGYCPDNITPRTPELVSHEVTEVDEPLPTWTQKCRTQNRRKRRRDSGSCSPLTKKIYVMQQELQKLLQERAASKKVRVPRRRLIRDYREYDSATGSDSNDSENAPVVQTGSRVRYARNTGVERTGHNLQTRCTRISRSHMWARD
jgi:hypothetical protein